MKPHSYIDPEGFCLICDKQGVDLHHILARGMGRRKPIDESWNLSPLCREHHTEIHKSGINTFAEKYPKFRRFLVEHLWTFFNGKWIAPLHK